MDRKQALEIVRKNYPHVSGSGTQFETALRTLIPELKMSEDERIRKQLIKETKGSEMRLFEIVTNDEFVAWLEKQGSQNLANSAKTCKVEPKFKVGDWVVNEFGRLKHITKIKNDCYYAEDEYGEWHGTFEYGDTHFRLWTIQDAKDGDVLLFEGNYNSIVLFQGIGINGKGRINYHCKCNLGDYSLGVQGDVAYLGTIENDAGHYHPATKEQCDLLFQKMKEVGYEWDADKKELKKIEQKPAWSEEDENRLKVVISFVNSNPAEDPFYDKGCLKDWLKSLKERYAWKPSDEQMEYLAKAITTLGNEGDNKTSARLCELRTDLKKLKG